MDTRSLLVSKAPPPTGYGVQRWRSETFKFSTDPDLVAKVADIVGLYLDPPDNAIAEVCGREVADSGVGSDRADVADADRDPGEANPRLGSPRCRRLLMVRYRFTCLPQLAYR